MTAPLKILHTHFGIDGGAERFFVNLVNGFGERGIEQQFILRPNRQWRHEIEALGPIIEHPYRRISIASLFLQHRVHRLVKQWQPNVIMAWMHRAARLTPAYDQALKVVRLGDFPRKLDHLMKCDVVVGNVPGICQKAENLGWTKRLQTISNFPRKVDANPIARSQLNTPEDAFVISAAGRIIRRKGFDTLLKAAQKVPHSFVWLMGDGDELEPLKTLAKELDIHDRIRFLGWVDEPMHYIAASDMFALPSRHEPLGNVILEAWQLDKPVVATKSEGPSWFMQHDQSGYLVDIDDVDEMARGITKIKTDKTYAQSLVEGGRKTNSTMFSKQAIIDQYMALFETSPSRNRAN